MDLKIPLDTDGMINTMILIKSHYTARYVSLFKLIRESFKLS